MKTEQQKTWRTEAHDKATTVSVRTLMNDDKPYNFKWFLKVKERLERPVLSLIVKVQKTSL